MATAVENAIAEIDKLLIVFAPQHEGLRDYARLNITEQTQQVVREAIRRYDRRVIVLNAAKAALQELMDDHHPDLPIMEIDLTALEDLRANAATIEAALARFTSNAASNMTMTGGHVEEK